MRPILKSFFLFIQQIRSDSMLVIVCFASLLAAFFFRFAIPQIENILCSVLGLQAILSPYYLLFDLLLIMLTPFMFCFASAMVMLEEYDVNLSSYLSVTPVGKKGYLVSRLLLPTAIACIGSLALLTGFSLTEWSLQPLFWTTLLSGFSAIIEAMLVFSYSRNKVEGMAIAKLSGLLMLGLPIPFFMQSNLRYLFCLLPSFWIASYAQTGIFWPVILALFLSFVYIGGFYQRFQLKLA
ncbi:hypothetical protein SpiGrapes_3083 [Sphaerochaeta pleomorpha str. Grapes]|uniref:Fluoroquinolones export permease protein n=1 Tax=Sphaerochaeta pleomorpha (strain ATCC BAA-1885 / DSM 22778 / Grapes) TaxID=158190 RepID=G8QYX1_SPHPG|nr:hypothetical protein [Sphaerochaeta pleomorpha]AEV30830.1 hypothetical protein SpiGrapes_3083 [Sphaerochaeta pleomorpha str. Grapes]